jgi:hypothetical protein
MIEQVIRSADRKYTIADPPPAAFPFGGLFRRATELSTELSHFRPQCLVRGRYKSDTFVISIQSRRHPRSVQGPLSVQALHAT